MAIRTDSVAVEGILRNANDVDGGDYDGVTNLDPYIETASSIVDDIVAYCAETGLTQYPSSKLELLERWLAAHAYKSSDQAYASESDGGASGSYQGQTGLNLNGTKYGQMANVLDTKGYLVALSTGGVSLKWGGKRFSEQIPYWDRD